MSKPTALLTGATVLTDQGWLENAVVLLDRHRILDIQPDLPPSLLFNQDDVEMIALKPDTLLTPGLIDLQFNGAFGVDFATAGIPAIQKLLTQLPQHGITGLLATLVTAPVMDMVSAINTLEETLHIAKLNQTRLLGIHLEGPFLNPARRGAHPEASLLEPELADLPLLLSPHVKLMTLAPERDTEGAILEVLQQHQVLAFAGHTQANLAQLHQAMDRGLVAVTHLFNAMEGFHHRKPGTALHALNLESLKVSVIADGHHVHPEVLRLVQKVKGTDNLLLVSDAMPLAGCPEGTTLPFAGQRVTLLNGTAVNQEGNLAGSVQLLDDMVRNLVRWNICPFEEAIRMASTNPARLLNQADEVGRIAPGCRADMVLWNRHDLSLAATWIEGKLKWCQDNEVPGASPSNLLQSQLAGCC